MRFLPPGIEQKINETKWTRANNCNPSLSLWIFRHSSPISNDQFLQTNILDMENVSSVDIAVRHRTLGKNSDTIFIAYIEDGIGKYVYSQYQYIFDRHEWHDGDLEIEGISDIAIAFDGDMPKDTSGIVEFVTEENPWFFWVKDGQCLANQLRSNRQTDILCDYGCTKVAAIKAVTSDYKGFDFGLIAFMVINNQLFYRQFIDGVWYDAELISKFTNYQIVDISVSRTFDYRLIVQAKDSDGIVHELISQYQGIAKQVSEHISANVNYAKGIIYKLTTKEGYENEHINVVINSISNLYKIGLVETILAYNVDDGSGNYGKVVKVLIDTELDQDSVNQSPREWTLEDSEGNIFIPRFSEVDDTGMLLTLTFTNFNMAEGQCSIKYLGTSVKYLSGDPVSEIVPAVFTPTELSPIFEPGPTFTSIECVGTDGTIIEIKFDQDLIDDNIDANKDYFNIISKEYDFYPNGTIKNRKKEVIRIDLVASDTIHLVFDSTRGNNVVNAEEIVVSYGTGYLGNNNGDVLPFETSFIPIGLDKLIIGPEEEHVSAETTVQSTLANLEYYEGYSSDHIYPYVRLESALILVDDL